jgi:MFS superfamily sulfate permease-like transporter
MLLAIILSLAHGIQLMMWPPAGELVHVPGSTIWWPAGSTPNGRRRPGVLVFAPAAPVNFTNASYVHDRLLSEIAAATPAVRLVVLEASAVTDFDYTGSQRVQATISELRERGIDVAIARLIVTHAQRAAERSGLIAALGADHLFMSVDEAVAALAPAAAE